MPEYIPDQPKPIKPLIPLSPKGLSEEAREALAANKRDMEASKARKSAEIRANLPNVNKSFEKVEGLNELAKKAFPHTKQNEPSWEKGITVETRYYRSKSGHEYPVTDAGLAAMRADDQAFLESSFRKKTKEPFK